MDILYFNEAKLIATLHQLTAQRQTLFAALIATRLSVAYRIYARHANLPLQDFRAASDYLWHQIERGIPYHGMEVDTQIEIVMALIPDEDSSWAYSAQADDAIAALAYALTSVKSANPQEVAWAARRAYECVDNLVISRDGVEIGGAAEERIVRDPLIQMELARQRDDLETATLSSLDPTMLLRHRNECVSWGVKFFRNQSGGVN